MPFEDVQSVPGMPFLAPSGSSVITEQLTVEETCNPWSSLIHCPLYLYIAISLVGLFMVYNALSGGDKKAGKKSGAASPSVQVGTSKNQSGATIVGLVIYVVISLLFGMIIYGQCKECNTGNAWLWLVVALLAPFIFVALTLGILSFVFGFAVGWMGTKDAKKGVKGKTDKKGSGDHIVVQ